MSQSNINQNITEFDLLNAPLTGHTLIEANAGTGKTFTISRLYLRLLLEKKLPASSILVVTFTEAATVELKERIHQLLRMCRDTFEKNTSNDPFFSMLLERVDHTFAIDQLTTALHTFDNCAIYTIHGFCRTVLTSNPFECGMSFQSEIITNQNDLVREITLDFWRKQIYQASEGFVAWLVNSNYNPLKLIELWSVASRSISEINILPESNPQPSISLEDQFRESVALVQQEWNSEQANIVNELNNGSLKANIYRTTTIAGLIDSMNRFCQSGPRLVAGTLFSDFQKLTISALRNSVKKNCPAPLHHFFTLCEALHDISVELTTSYINALLDFQRTYIRHMRCELALRKKKRNQLYFDDLLLNVDNALNNAHRSKLINALHGRYCAALIDEFQDTDEVQYRIFSTIFARSELPLFLIGDPKQSIYRFRGADIFVYLKATQLVDRKFTLSQNYRSQPGLIRAVNTLFNRANHLFLHNSITYTPSIYPAAKESRILKINGVPQTAMRWLCVEPQDGVTSPELMHYCAQKVAETISELISLGALGTATLGTENVSPRHIAILVRKNKEAELLHNALVSMEIPSIIESTGSVFSTQEAEELLRVLHALASPNRTDLIKSALLTPFFGLNINDLDTLTQKPEAWDTMIGRVFNYHDDWSEHGISYLLRQLMAEEQVRSRLLALPGGERKLTNIIHLGELLLHEEHSNRVGVKALLEWFNDKVTNHSDHVPDDEISRLESDSDCVSIVTVHKSKGLQFPIVFCPFCWHASSTTHKGDQGYILHSQGDNSPVLVLGKEEMARHQNDLERELLAEEMRLLYVALTRAESSCYALWCTHKTAQTSAVAYLLFSNGSENPPFSGLQIYMKQLTHNDIIQHFKNTFGHEPAISFEGVADVEQTKIPVSSTTSDGLTCKTLDRPLPDPWKITSFSSLSKTYHDADIFNDDSGPAPSASMHIDSKDEPFESIGTFPRGEIAGLFLHALLERVDLTMIGTYSNPELITELLNLYNFDPQWTNSIEKLLATIADVLLSNSGIQLKNIRAEDCIKELKFHFPVESLNHQDLKVALYDESPDLFNPTVYTGDGLDFKSVKGYMKGFIDLLFKVNDTFYILDWKSNHLGNDASNYTHEKMLNEMVSKHYILQYYIYTIAVNRFLTLRYTDYTYERNFGGVYYLFLRGLKPGMTTGIYYDRPKQQLIRRLDQLFYGGMELLRKISVPQNKTT